MLDYIIYGIVDNGIMIIGAMTGYELERYIPKKFQKGLGVYIGAGLGNTASDFLGGMSTLNIELATGTAAGCVLGLLFIPAIIYLGRLRRLIKNKYFYFSEEF